MITWKSKKGLLNDLHCNKIFVRETKIMAKEMCYPEAGVSCARKQKAVCIPIRERTNHERQKLIKGKRKG